MGGVESASVRGQLPKPVFVPKPIEELEPDIPDVDDYIPPDDGGDDGGDEPGDDNHGEPIRWITVATFWQSAEAHIAKLKLESESIPCVLLDENLVSTDWLYANAAGGIKLQVPDDQVARADGLLLTDAQRVMKLADGEPVLDGQAGCPRCGSRDIYRSRYSKRWAFLSILVLGLPLPIRFARTRCAACSFEWK